MNELTVSNQHTKWKRFFNGGILSASIAGIPLLALIFDGRRGDNPLWIFYVFMVPGFIFQKLTGADTLMALFLFNCFFWFLAGAVAASFVKSNRHAIAIWVLLLVACIFGFGYLSFLFSP